MQMYMVKYTIQHVDCLEIGKVIVCAKSADEAKTMVRMLKNSQLDYSELEASRIKPNMYQISRQEFEKPKVNPANMIERSAHGPAAELSVWRMAIRAEVKAYDEPHAWRRLSAAIADRASAAPREREKWILDIAMAADREKDNPKPAAIEKQAIYTSTRVFAGGAARPR